MKDLFDEAVKVSIENHLTVQEFIGAMECAKLSFFWAAMKTKEKYEPTTVLNEEI